MGLSRVETASITHVVSPAPRDTWAEILASDPNASTQQTPAWFDVALRIRRATDASRLYELEDGRRLVLLLARRRLAPGVSFDESPPKRYGQGGMIATGGLRDSDVRRVLTDLGGSRAVATRLIGNFQTLDAWREGRVPGVGQVSHRNEVLDLDGGFEGVYGGFHSSVRRALRKAERSGLTVEHGTASGLVQAHYGVYLAWMERVAQEKGIPRAVALARARRQDPLEKYQAIADLLPDDCRIWVASHEGEPIASMVTLMQGDHATYWRGYSRKELAGPLRANVLLQRLAIEEACRAGCRYYDFGESGGVAALERFKQNFGAKPRCSLELWVERIPITRLDAARKQLRAQVVRQLKRRASTTQDGA